VIVWYNWIYNKLPMQSVPITASCEFKFCPGEVYLIQHYVIKFFSDLRQNHRYSSFLHL